MHLPVTIHDEHWQRDVAQARTRVDCGMSFNHLVGAASSVGGTSKPSVLAVQLLALRAHLNHGSNNP
jgi:hypothetical protein